MSLLGTKRARTTAYHPQSNDMIESFHRQLKTALKAQHNSTQSIDLLPLVLLGIRSAVKQDLSTSTAELFYGTTLRLPGEFFTSLSQQTVLNPAEYVTQLKTHMQTIRAKSPRLPNRKSSIDGALLTCTHVFVRCDAVRKLLQPPYDGPYRVFDRKEKYYIVELKGRTDSILEKWFPLWGERAHSMKLFLYVR